MSRKIRSNISLNTVSLNEYEQISDRLKKLSCNKNNFSNIIELVVFYLAGLESGELELVFTENKNIIKWQTKQEIIKEKNVTITKDTKMMLDQIANNIKNTDYKIYHSGIIRVGFFLLKNINDNELLALYCQLFSCEQNN